MKALLVVDIQNDFLPGGALPVPEGDQVIPVINSLMEKDWDLIIATKDWHPANHGSFADVQGKKPGEIIQLGGVPQILWPRHCVQNTLGAELAKAFHNNKIDHIILKGVDPEIDSYSAFFDNGHRRDTGLHKILKKSNIEDLFIAGLATDYCVFWSVLDALHLGYKVTLILDGCRGIDLHWGDIAKALEEMKKKGVKIVF